MSSSEVLLIHNYTHLKYPLEDLKKFLPKDIVLSNNDFYGFNMGSVVLPGTDKEVYCFRFLITKRSAGSKSGRVIPGNDVMSPVIQNVGKELSGQNFFWSRWPEAIFDRTFVMIGKYDGCQVYKCSSFLALPYGVNNKVMGVDYRLVMMDGLLYAYPRSFEVIMKIHVDGDTLSLGEVSLMRLELSISESQDTRHFNASIVKTSPQEVLVIDIFGKNGLSFILLDRAHRFSKLREVVISYHMDSLLCLGSSTKPMFSMGTPCIPVGNDMYLGMGHVKLKNNYTKHISPSYQDYPSDCRIYQIRETVHDQLFDLFGQNYITHYGHSDGYIYLAYFYLVHAPSMVPLSVKISDAFLPVNLSKEVCSDFKSSLFFPVGIYEKVCNDKTMIQVTGGEYDFLSTLLSFELSDVLRECCYDVSYFVEGDFQYRFLVFYDGQSHDLLIEYNGVLCKETSKKYNTLKSFLRDVQYPHTITAASREY